MRLTTANAQQTQRYATLAVAWGLLASATAQAQGVRKYSYESLNDLWDEQGLGLAPTLKTGWYQKTLLERGPGVEAGGKGLGRAAAMSRRSSSGNTQALPIFLHAAPITANEAHLLVGREFELMLYLDKGNHYEAQRTPVVEEGLTGVDKQRALEDVQRVTNENVQRAQTLSARAYYAQLELYYIHLIRYHAASRIPDKCAHIRKARDAKLYLAAHESMASESEENLCLDSKLDCDERRRFKELQAFLVEVNTGGVGPGADVDNALVCGVAELQSSAQDFAYARSLLEEKIVADLTDPKGEIQAALVGIGNAQTSLRDLKQSVMAQVPPTSILAPLERAVANAKANYELVQDDEMNVGDTLEAMYATVDLEAIRRLRKVSDPNNQTQLQQTEPLPKARAALEDLQDAHTAFLETLASLQPLAPTLGVCGDAATSQADTEAVVGDCFVALNEWLASLQGDSTLERQMATFVHSLKVLSDEILAVKRGH